VKLHINVDHVATLRQARGTRYPEPRIAAELCERAGADGITVHLREDRRHIQDEDVKVLRKQVRGVLNLEMAATDEMVAFALAVRPDIVTLVPEKREERTTEGGLDLVGHQASIARAITTLRAERIPVSLFIDPTEPAVRGAEALGVRRIELHTGDYCERADAGDGGVNDEVARLRYAARLGSALSLHVAAGHGLNVDNVAEVAALRQIEELNIGHAIVARAVFLGLESAVAEMIAAVRSARSRA
jgi:pyridoxine 5-phosphate synthase